MGRIVIEKGKEISLIVNAFGSPTRVGDYYRIKGYRGTFRELKEHDLGPQPIYRIFIIREEVPNSYNGDVHKLRLCKGRFPTGREE